VESVVRGPAHPARLELRLHHRRVPAQPPAGGVLLESYDIDGVIVLDLPDSEVRRRVLNRRLCADCGMDYHLIDSSPKVPGQCDSCGGELVTREDDTERRWR
jgi:adenylate kinase